MEGQREQGAKTSPSKRANALKPFKLARKLTNKGSRSLKRLEGRKHK